VRPDFDHHIERLSLALKDVEPAPRAVLANNRNAAAVLVPLFERSREIHVVYIRRSDHVESHRGQVAFPGGRVDPKDRTLLDAALREAHEEVGIPPHEVKVLGGFSAAQTTTTGIIVAPFVGVIPSTLPLTPEPHEVAEIFDVPLSALRDPAYRGDYEWNQNGAVRRFPAILYGGQTIWGLTLRITEHLLDVLKD
jgi:8-oxo-dGTP pyrophosphatase MutT (NUDIX family)